MRNFTPLLLSLFALTSCKEDPPLATTTPDSAESVEEDVIEMSPIEEDTIFSVQDYGVYSMDGLLPYATDLSADLGSHRWIYKLGEDGKAKWGLLLKKKNRREIRSEGNVQPFLETYENGWKIRRLLTTEEAFAKLEIVEAAIRTEGHLERYEYFYDGGRMAEETGSGADKDPFATTLIEDTDQTEIDDEITNHVNDSSLFQIATWIRNFRRGYGLPIYDFPEGSVGQRLDWNKVRYVLAFDADYEPQTRAPHKLNTMFTMGEVVRKIGFQKANGKLPLVFTPYFAVLVLMGSDDEVVSIISVQTSNAYCVARAGSRNEEGHYIIDHDAIQAEFHSPYLSKLLYESFQMNDPEYLEKVKYFFGGKPTLEEQILGRRQ